MIYAYDHNSGDIEVFKDVQELFDCHNKNNMSDYSFFTDKRKLEKAIRGLR